MFKRISPVPDWCRINQQTAGCTLPKAGGDWLWTSGFYGSLAKTNFVGDVIPFKLEESVKL